MSHGPEARYEPGSKLLVPAGPQGVEQVASLVDLGPETRPRSQLCDIAGWGGHAPHVMAFLGVIRVANLHPTTAATSASSDIT